MIAQLRERLPDGWRATLGAVDGSTVAGLAQQLARIPEGATHLVISAGGNDALGYASILAAPSRSMTESLAQLADIGDAFQAHYRAAVENVLGRRAADSCLHHLRPTLSTIPVQRRLGATALTIINDAIIREAVRFGLPGRIDLRLVCSALPFLAGFAAEPEATGRHERDADDFAEHRPIFMPADRGADGVLGDQNMRQLIGRQPGKPRRRLAQRQ